MTLELMLLIGLTVYLIVGAYMKDFGSKGVFSQSGPRLGARIERNLATGQGFKNSHNQGVEWIVPSSPDTSINEGNLK